MRMSRDVETIAAAVFSAEHIELEPITCLAQLDLNKDLQKHVVQFEEIAKHIATLPSEIQSNLAEVAKLSFDQLEQLGGIPLFRTPEKH